MPTPERENLIRSGWENVGRPRWNEAVHGNGVPLCVPISEVMQTPRPGMKIEPPAELKYRLMIAYTNGTKVRSVVCEGADSPATSKRIQSAFPGVARHPRNSAGPNFPRRVAQESAGRLPRMLGTTRHERRWLASPP
jgi:hypothetical protein